MYGTVSGNGRQLTVAHQLRCPDIVWNPYRRKFSILVRILADGRTTDIPLGRFLREFTCDRPD
ncbi:hypothetical protein OFC24_28265, partial [Escherichia coli]|nr:hypothetical protein [Escherichia coli]